MLHLRYSNRFERLTSALADALAAGGVLDVFAPATVVVPNRLIASAVRLAVARRHGVAGGLRFSYFEGLIAELVKTARPGWKPLDRQAISALLLSVYDDPERMAHDELAPVRAYLSTDTAVEVRRAQLAEQVATLFCDYALHRPDMVARWQAAPIAPGASVTEIWQRRLWLALFGPGGYVDRCAPVDSRWHLATSLLSELTDGELTVPTSIHVIGFSYLPAGHRPVVHRLAQLSEVSWYGLNPCREYWDDAVKPRAGGVGDEGDTPALMLWGRPGREHVAAMAELTHGDFTSDFERSESAPSSALARLQRDILDRRPVRRAGDRAAAPSADRSIRVLACPGVRRELEVIGNHIVRLLDSDASLRACDIALLLAPSVRERYEAQLGAVFDELGGIPFRMVDATSPGESRVAEAIDLLLDLPLGRFTRPELLGLMIHPAHLARYPSVDRDEWVGFCETLGIVHGADRNDHQGTYIEGDFFNWDQGIRRLALGAFMGADIDGRPPAVIVGGQAYSPALLEPGERASAARFAQTARALIAMARDFRAGPRPLASWARAIDSAIGEHLAARGPDDDDQLTRAREVIRRLADRDFDERPVPYASVRELLREPLASATATGGDVPTDAVMVGPLATMRPLPYRVVFIAGLGGTAFPASDPTTPFDLRSEGRRPGEVTPRDRDRYGFLEALISARDQLLLSYVARDEESGEALEPSSVVHELSEMLLDGYLHPDDAAELIERHPLRRFDDALATDPVSLRQRYCRTIRQSIEEHTGRRGPPDATTLARRLADEPAVAEILGLPRPHRMIEADEPPTLALPPQAGRGGTKPLARRQLVEPRWLSLAALRKFLECPMQAWAQSTLGLRGEGDDEDIHRTDEPFEAGAMHTAMSLRQIFIDHLRTGGGEAELISRYRQASVRDRMDGLAPTGPFAAGAERRALSVLRSWLAAVVDLAGERPGCTSYGFGRVAEGRAIGQLAPAIAIEAAGVPLYLYGQTGAIVGSAAVGSLMLVTGDSFSPRHWIRLLFDTMVLAAAGVIDGDHTITSLSRSGKLERYRLGHLDADSARAHLASLASELLTGNHNYLLPCEVSWPAARKGESDPDAIAQEVERLTRTPGFFSSRAGPLRLTPDLAPPAQATEMIRARFDFWLDRMEAM